MDIVIAQLALPPQAPLDAPIGVGPGTADPSATARFNEIMGTQQTPLSEAIEQAYPPIPATGGTMGESILSGLKNLSADFRQSWSTVNAALEAGPKMTNTELLKLQLGLTQMSVQYDLVGKAIGRSTQNLDQLVKLQ
jgi:type III secretion protein I